MDLDETQRGVCSRTDLYPPPVGLRTNSKSFCCKYKTLNGVIRMGFV
jgi:hypothetical protein